VTDRSAAPDDVVETLRKTVSDAAHSLNNLFAITLGRAEMLLDDDGSDLELRRECLESIRRAAAEGRELVQRLRVVAQLRPEARKSRFG
jgi:signal transduction histidine kinase